jgi:hypothetical protein
MRHGRIVEIEEVIAQEHDDDDHRGPIRRQEIARAQGRLPEAVEPAARIQHMARRQDRATRLGLEQAREVLGGRHDAVDVAVPDDEHARPLELTRELGEAQEAVCVAALLDLFRSHAVESGHRHADRARPTRAEARHRIDDECLLAVPGRLRARVGIDADGHRAPRPTEQLADETRKADGERGRDGGEQEAG